MKEILFTEQLIIAGMVESKLFYSNAVEKLKPEYFTSADMSRAFEALVKRGEGDYITVENAVQHTDASFVYEYGFSVTGESEFEAVISAYKRREGLMYLSDALNRLKDTENDPDEVLSDLSGNSFSVSSQFDETVPISSLLSAEVDRQIKVHEKGTSAFIKTGIDKLDDAICIKQTDYVIIGARPSNGKSSLSGYIARNVCKAGGVAVMFYLDSSKENEVSRHTFSEAGVDLRAFNSGFVKKSDAPKIQYAMNKLNEMKLYINSPDTATPEKIMASAMKVKNTEGRLDVIVVDFIQNVDSSKKFFSLREKMNYISKSLHNIAKAVKCPVIALSQLSRYEREENNAPTMKNLKETGNLEQDADIVMLLYYPQHYESKGRSEPTERNTLDVYIAKFKDGDTSKTRINYNAATYSFPNIKKTDMNGESVF